MAVRRASAAAADASGKSPDAYRTISEASEILGVPQHVLRFWETRFSQVRPVKRAGGRRYYRPEDIALLSRIRALLHDEGYSIRGVQRLFRTHGVRAVVDGSAASAAGPQVPQAGAEPGRRAELQAILGELVAARDLLP